MRCAECTQRICRPTLRRPRLECPPSSFVISQRQESRSRSSERGLPLVARPHSLGRAVVSWCILQALGRYAHCTAPCDGLYRPLFWIARTVVSFSCPLAGVVCSEPRQLPRPPLALCCARVVAVEVLFRSGAGSGLTLRWPCPDAANVRPGGACHPADHSLL